MYFRFLHAFLVLDNSLYTFSFRYFLSHSILKTFVLRRMIFFLKGAHELSMKIISVR